MAFSFNGTFIAAAPVGSFPVNVKNDCKAAPGDAPTRQHEFALIDVERRSIIARMNARLLGLLLTLVAVSSGPSRAADWPQFLGPTRDGVYAGIDVAASWGKTGPPVVWQRDIGQGFSGPAVVDKRLVIFHRVGNREVLDCLDAETGKPVWSDASPTTYTDDFGFDEGPRATPTIVGGRVYTFGAQGALICRDFATGKPVWSVDTAAEFGAPKGFFGMACSPLVEGDLVVLNVGGKPDAGVVAFDAKTGQVRWRATGDDASYASPVAATIAGERRVFVFTAAGLLVLQPKDGAVVSTFPWRARIRASVNAATPLVIGDAVFLSASYDTGAVLLRVRGRELEKVWSGDDSLSNHYATSVHHGGFLYGFHGRQEQGPSLRCVELNTGKVRWEVEGFGAGSILLADDKLLVLTEKGQLIVAPAAPDGFKPTAKAQILPFDCRAYPALADGKLYARSKDKLVCVDLRANPAAAQP
jgi:outer membrane protein assembly factor BamB